MAASVWFRWARVGAWLLAVLVLPGGAAAQPSAPVADPALERRVRDITTELRCLVCQNETVAESSAGLAQDLREEVRRLLKAGRSEEQILQHMTDRYGDFVRYRPPVQASTLLLWYGPAVLMAGGLVTLFVLLRRRERLDDDWFESEGQAEAEPEEGARP
ncbi:cytochrome c-type biogenesis protein CcmH [Aquabacterium sp. A7-Y]|uniref:cytochrome c-type biogenesis protein n=1 Tax=Aquabacterium sp. A7-Y TaxID=1349605 RepID=UPI00223CE7FE|nr:cytochrome c-type biogenesis protein [Aquabacterium sp. A7-Y]MCW7538569.1 cytochrome c-type biogenesis protein CcmH [Aquabacterium sp. A7-Y]